MALAALAVSGAIGCDGDESSDVVAQCDQLAGACGDGEEHVETIGQECKELVDRTGADACADAALALFDCYERELCERDDAVWALDDLRVLSERHETCLDQRDALNLCLENGASRD